MLLAAFRLRIEVQVGLIMRLGRVGLLPRLEFDMRQPDIKGLPIPSDPAIRRFWSRRMNILGLGSWSCRVAINETRPRLHSTGRRPRLLGLAGAGLCGL